MSAYLTPTFVLKPVASINTNIIEPKSIIINELSNTSNLLNYISKQIIIADK